MDYILYTPDVLLFSGGESEGPEFVLYKDADQYAVLDEIYDASTCNTGFCFWLGASADAPQK